MRRIPQLPSSAYIYLAHSEGVAKLFKILMNFIRYPVEFHS